MRLSVLALLLFVAAAPEAQDRAIRFPDVPGLHTMVVDLHTHSVFSDGEVWPTIRVREAIRDGLDAFAVTEHLEYQPHRHDIPHPDRDRAAEIASGAARVPPPEDDSTGTFPLDSARVIVIPGAEITRDLPYGHANAVFVRDADALLQADAADAFREAKRQGAYTFLNHPNWTRQRPDGVARLSDAHRQLLAEGLIDGVEVVNEMTYSDEALQLALDHGLAILGTSDIHGLVDWQFGLASGGHRPVTLVLAPERSARGLRAGLDSARTVAYFVHSLIGRERDLIPLLRASLQTEVVTYGKNISILYVELVNRSSAPLILENRSGFTMHDGVGVFTVPPHGSLMIQLKTRQRLETVPLAFAVLNAVTAPGMHPVIEMEPDVQP